MFRSNFLQSAFFYCINTNNKVLTAGKSDASDKLNDDSSDDELTTLRKALKRIKNDSQISDHKDYKRERQTEVALFELFTFLSQIK